VYFLIGIEHILLKPEERNRDKEQEEKQNNGFAL
jgi:hypothetical protein